MHYRFRQSGVALFVTLIVLLVVSLLSAGAMRMSLSQSKISLNTRLDTMAFQAAESGIRAVIMEAASANVANTNNVIGGTLALGICNDANSTDPTCVVFRCVTQGNPMLAGACTGTAALDGPGSLRTESRTRHTGQFNVVNSSVSVYRDYVFETVSTGCVLDDSQCSDTHWRQNVQEFKKMAPADPAANYD